VLFSFTFQAFLTIALHSEIADLATTDGLTGLHNHRTFQEKLSEELKRAERYGFSCYPNDAKTQQQLIGKADEFLFFDEKKGHNMTYNPWIVARINNEH
jgi:GGDEF domain-containing protein